MKRFICLIILYMYSSMSFSLSDYNIGVFYYPGWKSKTISNVAQEPWAKIKRYNDLKPLVGFYAEDDPNVMSTQINWMKQYGVKFVVLDWYWNKNLKVLKPHAIKKLRNTVKQEGFQYAIMWANHPESPSSITDFDRMIKEISSYTSDKNYYREDGRPVIYIFSARLFSNQAKKIGEDADSLLHRAKVGIKSITGVEPVIYISDSAYYFSKVNKSKWSNADGIFAYNYHGLAEGFYENRRNISHNYIELIAGYLNNWNWFLRNINMNYHVPVTSGWDRTPWGGSDDPQHDKSSSTSSEFKLHLQQAKIFIDKQPDKTKKTMLICCWNEFGEGSYIEPTVKYQMEYLQQIKDVFYGSK